MQKDKSARSTTRFARRDTGSFVHSSCSSVIDLETELKTMDKVSKEICRTKSSARDFLVTNGFLTPTGRIPKRYK